MLCEMNPRKSVKEVSWITAAENLTWGLKWAMGYFTDAKHLWFPEGTGNCGCSEAIKSKPLSMIIFLQDDFYHEILHISSTWHLSRNFVSQPAPDFMPLYKYMFLTRSQHLKTIKEFPCLKKEKIHMRNYDYTWEWWVSHDCDKIPHCWQPWDPELWQMERNPHTAADLCFFLDHEPQLLQGCSQFRQ